MTYLLLAISYLLFAILAWRRLPLAVLLAIAALPSYLIRFSVGAIPMTVLESMIIMVVIVWGIKRARTWRNESGIRNQESGKPKSIIHNSLFIIPLTLFLAAATVSMFVAPDLRAAAGIWKAYFIEPILFFLVLRDLMKNQVTGYRLQVTRNHIVSALSITALVLAVYAIYQRVSGFGIPSPWDKELRVTSIFPYPNALALFLGPLVPLIMAQIFQKKKKLSVTGYWLLVTSASLLAIIFAKSTGALVGVAAGLLVMTFLFLSSRGAPRWPSEGDVAISRHGKRLPRSLRSLAMTIILTVLVGAAALAIPTLKNELLLRDWSGHVRRTQWSETIKMLKDRPILGAGLSGYPEALKPYHKATYLEIFQYPHNIVLNFWSEIGLLGLIAFIWLIIVFYKQSLKKLPVTGYLPAQAGALQVTGITAAMTTLLVHGLVDVPYFKNDLAILFWIVYALGAVHESR